MKLTEIAALVAEESNDYIYMVDTATYELVYLNQTCRKLLGEPPDSAWLGKPCYQVLQGKDAPCEFCNGDLLETDRFHSWCYYNAVFRRYFSVKDKLVELNGRQLRLEIAGDVTEIEEANRTLRHKLYTEETLMECIRCLSHGDSLNGSIGSLLRLVGGYYGGDRAYIFELDQEGKTLSNTHEWCGAGSASHIDQLERVPLSSVEPLMERLRQEGEVCIRNLDSPADPYGLPGTQGVSSLIAAPLQEEGGITGFVGVDNPRENAEDLTLLRSLPLFLVEELAKRRLTDRLQTLSYTDSLTGAGNRHKYTETLEALRKNPPASVGIVYLDVNGLKLVNDTYGHEFGDRVLRHTAQVLEELCPGKVYRVGGDEFVILCPGVSHDDFYALVNALHQRAAKDGNFNPAIGSSWNEGPEIDILRLAAYSDQAMSVDKQVYYSKRMEGSGDYHFQLSQGLCQELKAGRFSVYLQPQVDLRTGALRGSEALVRRRDKEDHLIPPMQFIPFFEAEGLVRHVDFFVLDTVCAALQNWARLGKADLPPIAVNFSRVTMVEHDIVAKLLEVCDRRQVRPAQIKIEITESVGSIDRTTLRNLIVSLKAAGFFVSLDDFGAEYSNLALLSENYFDELKLDKSLVENLEVSPNALIITEHTLQVCKELGGVVSVAEGIETAGQWDILTKLYCDVGQGFFFDRPMSIEAFEKKYVLT